MTFCYMKASKPTMKPAAQREAALFQAAAQLTGSAHTGVVQGAVGEIVAAAG